MSEATSILYTNWRGETAVRRIIPGLLWFGSTEWHPDPQWLLTADEPDTGKRRDFALSGIKAWGDEAIIDAQLLAADCDVMRKALVVARHGLMPCKTLEVINEALESKCDAPGFHTAFFTARKQEPAA